MSFLPSRCGAILLAALAASCWDGSLDPILGAPDGGDADSDSDGDTDSETGDTDPAPCAVSVVVYVEDGETYEPYCDFAYEGVCRSAASECEGCAWQDAENELCDGSGVCCVPETSYATCDPYVWWWPSSLCGYFSGECPEDTVSLESLEGQPECQDGEFCCYLIDSKR